MGKSNNIDQNNLEKYKASLKQRGYDSLPTSVPEQSLDEIIAEGDRLLKEDISKTNGSKTSTSPKSPAVSVGNPYFKARAQIIDGLDSEKKKLIAKMEASGDTNNYIYNDFIKQVAILGDKLSG